MTYDQAIMVTRNATAYPSEKIREAAVYVLGALDASEEDILDAGAALGLLDCRNRVAILPRAHFDQFIPAK